ncbi:MAG: hypothetical protein ACOWWR_09050 [Eubacteriales bacterium]
MSQIVRHELYKIFSRKSIILIFVLFIGLYVLFTKGDIERTIKYNSIPEKYSSEFQGALTQEKIDKAVEFKEMVEDEDGEYREWFSEENGAIQGSRMTEEGRILYSVSEEVAHAQLLKEDLNNRIIDLEKTLGALQSSYNYRRNLLEYNMLRDLKEPGIYFSEAWKKIIDFINTLGLVFVGGLVLFGVAPIFSDEYTSNMDGIILSTKNGKKKLVTAKITAAILYIILVSVAFAAINFLVSICAFGISGWSDPIQSITKYIRSPYLLSTLQYHLIQLLFQTAGGIALGLFTLAISVITRHSLIPFFIGGGIFAFPELAESFIGDTGLLKTLTNFSYTIVMKVEALFMNFRAFNVLGFPVLYPVLAVVVMLLLSLTTVIFIYNVFRRHQVTG